MSSSGELISTARAEVVSLLFRKSHLDQPRDNHPFYSALIDRVSSKTRGLPRCHAVVADLGPTRPLKRGWLDLVWPVVVLAVTFNGFSRVFFLEATRQQGIWR